MACDKHILVYAPNCQNCIANQKKKASASASLNSLAHTNVIQPCKLNKLKPKIQYYEEKKYDKEHPYLIPIAKDRYDEIDDVATSEMGFEAISLEWRKFPPQDPGTWTYSNLFMDCDGANLVPKKHKSKLPVSCIEASHHVMMQIKNQLQGQDSAADYSEGCLAEAPLFLSFPTKDKTTVVIEEPEKGFLTDPVRVRLAGATSILSNQLAIGEALMILNLARDDWEESMHVVVVVARHSTGRIIVIERNAGNTSGKALNPDAEWLFRDYARPTSFAQSYAGGAPWKDLFLAKLTVSDPRTSGSSDSSYKWSTVSKPEAKPEANEHFLRNRMEGPKK